MLHGEAKRAYQREYMRRKRAGEPSRKPKQLKQPKPKQPRPPTQRMITQVAYWFMLKQKGNLRRSNIGWPVVHDLDPNNEAEWSEALQRYRTLRAERRVENKRKQAERDKPEPPEPNRCSFCGEPASEDRLLVGDGRHQFICEPCTKQAAAEFAKAREGMPH